jgi:hypothetical protein
LLTLFPIHVLISFLLLFQLLTLSSSILILAKMIFTLSSAQNSEWFAGGLKPPTMYLVYLVSLRLSSSWRSVDFCSTKRLSRFNFILFYLFYYFPRKKKIHYCLFLLLALSLHYSDIRLCACSPSPHAAVSASLGESQLARRPRGCCSMCITVSCPCGGLRYLIRADRGPRPRSERRIIVFDSENYK